MNKKFKRLPHLPLSFDVNDIEKSVREILQSEKAQSLIQKKETFDIIVLNEKK